MQSVIQTAFGEPINGFLMPKKILKKTRNLVAFDAPDDLMRLIKLAEKATGSTKTDLIIKSLQKNLPEIVGSIALELKRGQDEFLSFAKEMKSSTKTKE